MYVRVVVDAGAASYLDSFTYEVPENLIDRVEIGSCVFVPFGKSQVTGYVVAIDETTELEKTKPILAVINSPIKLSKEFIRLAEWLSERYLCGLSRCANSILPGVLQWRVRTMYDLASDEIDDNSPVIDAIRSNGGSISIESIKNKVSDAQNEVRKLERKGVIARRYELQSPQGKTKTAAAVKLAVSVDFAMAEAKSLMSKAPKQAQLLQYVAASGTVLCSKVSASPVSALESKGLITKFQIAIRRAPGHTSVPTTAHYDLTPDQQSTLEAIKSGIDAQKHEVLLMHGVTASGKTEVYLRAIEYARDKGLRSLVLLPEISLTTQVLNIFKGRFGDRVAVLHSMLSAGERFDEWMRAQNGEVDVVLGARSAVFAPIDNIGLVIVDEEHEPSYKQDADPRYHCRDVALRRAEEHGALAVLGSATPSVESYFKAKSGNYNMAVLQERIENRPMPEVIVADIREEYQKGKATIFTKALTDGITDRLAKGQQVILFQNRRAYATFLLCRECGHTPECPNCAVSLKLHASERVLRCHHCDYEQEAPTTCPKCGGRKIGKFGIGTERIEEETKTMFPEARVLRMDRDTTTKKGSHGAILDAFRKKEADILVGTQMIAKGLDFPGVTLVGVISADTSLNLPDYSAGERTFQLLSQVAGRAGRGTEPGEVVIQTFNPEHYAVVAAASHDYIGFYEQEIEKRQEHGYPPFGSVANIVSSDENEEEARKRLDTLVAELDKQANNGDTIIDILGPVPSPVSKLRGEFRWHVMLRCPERNVLIDGLQKTLEALPSIKRSVVVDIDPSSML